MPDEYAKIEGNGLLQNYQKSAPALEEALRRRRQRLAEEKIGLSPTPGEESEE